MAVSGLDGGWLSAHLGDPEIAACFSDQAEISAMIRVEAALSAVQGSMGTIPAETGARLSRDMPAITLETTDLFDGTRASGIPVPALVGAIRDRVSVEDAPFVHFGATTQDILDTGLILRLRDVIDVLEARLERLVGLLCAQADAYRGHVMAARTWGQVATPTTLGLRIAGWIAPLLRHQARLTELKPRLLCLQWGGASGTLASMGPDAEALEDGIARELGLTVATKPWHAERDALVEFAGWLSLVTGSIGKSGADLKIMSASGEARAGNAGRSSTMPQKANPVGPEALQTLARFNAAQISAMHGALVHAEERDAGPWQTEWLVLPQMAVATGAALRHALDLAETLTADKSVMASVIDAQNGTLLAEAAQFALAVHMPRPEATALVKAAIVEAGPSGNLFDALRQMTDAQVDWDVVSDPACYTGCADSLIDRVLREAGYKI